MALKLLTGKTTSEPCSTAFHALHSFSSPRPRKGSCIWRLFFSVTGLDLKFRPRLSWRKFPNAERFYLPQPLTSARSSGLKAPPPSPHTPFSLSSDLVTTSCRHTASSCQPGITPRKAALGLSYFISLPNLTLTLTDKDKGAAKRQGIARIIQAPPN